MILTEQETQSNQTYQSQLQWYRLSQCQGTPIKRVLGPTQIYKLPGSMLKPMPKLKKEQMQTCVFCLKHIQL